MTKLDILQAEHDVMCRAIEVIEIEKAKVDLNYLIGVIVLADKLLQCVEKDGAELPKSAE